MIILLIKETEARGDWSHVSTSELTSFESAFRHWFVDTSESDEDDAKSRLEGCEYLMIRVRQGPQVCSRVVIWTPAQWSVKTS